MIDICIIDNGIETLTNRTLESISEIEDADFFVNRIDIRDLHKVNKYDFKNEYVLFMYSGDELNEDVCKFLGFSADKTNNKKDWVCFYDDSIKYTNNSCEIVNNIYAVNCVFVCKELLASIDIEYKGYRYLTYMYELLTKLEEKQSGIFVDEKVVNTNLNRDYLVDDLDYINSLLSDLNNKINNDPFKYGIYQIDESDINNIKNEKISLCMLSDDSCIENINDNNIEIINCDNNDTYLNTCFRALNKATGKYLVFCNSKCVLDSSDDLYRLLAYASLKNAGAISPIINNGKKIEYSGITSLYQKQEIINKEDIWPEQEDKIYVIREVSYNSPLFWVIERSKLEAIINDTFFDDCSNDRTMFQINKALEKQNYKNLIIGNIEIENKKTINQKQYGNLFELMSTYRYDFIFNSKIGSIAGYNSSKKYMNNKQIYLPASIDKTNGKNILILSHELSLTGAPIVLMQAIELLLKNSYNVFVCSFKDGPLRKDLLNLNIPIMIMSNETEEYNWDSIIDDFDYVLINTVVPFREVNRFTKYNKKVIWWLHDAKLGYDEYLKGVIPNSINSNVDIYAVSEYAKQACTRYRSNYKIDILPYGIVDRASDEYTNPYNTNKKVYLCVGTIETRKGQDVLIDAIRKLPSDIRNDCLFVFVGRRLTNDRNIIYEQICSLKNRYKDNVEYIESIPHDELLSYIKYADAVVCPSKDDPLPTVMSETMMFSNVCICSSNTGTANFIKNGVSGYIYGRDDSNKLLECIVDSYKNSNSDEIGREARKVFENNFKLDILERRLLEIFK